MERNLDLNFDIITSRIFHPFLYNYLSSFVNRVTITEKKRRRDVDGVVSLNPLLADNISLFYKHNLCAVEGFTFNLRGI